VPRIVRLLLASVMLATLVSMLLSGAALAATTHYVNPGDDIQAVINNASPGDTIQFAQGTYTLTSQLVINKSLTLKSEIPCRPNKPVIDGGGTVYRMLLIDADNVIIEGLEITNGTGDLIRQSNAHSGTIVRHCIVHNALDDEGIQLTNCTNCYISSNLIYDVAQDGIAVSSNSVNCTIIDNEIYDSRSENGAILVYDSYSITIRGNYIHDTTAADGITIDDSYSGTFIIVHNLIVNNTWQGGNHNTEEADGNSIMIYSPRLGGTYNIEHNTLDNNTGVDGDGNPTGHGIYLNDGRAIGSSFVTNVKDNIITNHNGYGIRTYNWTNGAIVNYSYNDIWNNTLGITDGNPIDGGDNISADPLFNSTHRLRTGSPAISAASDGYDMGVLFSYLLSQWMCPPPLPRVPVFPNIYIGIGAAFGATAVAYLIRKRLVTPDCQGY